jgi:hypothetical protein
MICGLGRCKHDYAYYNAKPILLAIDTQKYADQMKIGLEGEGHEIEIEGKIDFKDVTVVDSLEKLLEVCPHAKDFEIDGFKREYLPTFQHDIKK